MAADSVVVRDELVGLVYAREIGLSDCGAYFSIVLLNNTPYRFMFAGDPLFIMEHFSLFRWRRAPMRWGRTGFTDPGATLLAYNEAELYIRVGVYRRGVDAYRRRRWRIDLWCDDSRPLRLLHTVFVN